MFIRHLTTLQSFDRNNMLESIELLIIWNDSLEGKMKSFSDEWEKIHSTRGWGQYPSEPIIRFVARNFYNKNRSEIKILDFGCGQGAHTWYLAREGFDTFAFDGSHSAVEKAKKYLEAENLKADFRVMDGVNLEYPNSFFDAVIDNVTICHNQIDNIQLMYKNVFRVLKKGGKLFTSSFSTDTSGYGSGKEIEKGTFFNVEYGPLKDKGNVHFWTQNDFFDIVKYAGFKNIKIDKNNYSDTGNVIDLLILTAEKT